MKKHLILLLALIMTGCVIGCVSSVPKGYTPIGGDLYVKHDRFKGVSFIQHKYYFHPIHRNAVKIYEVEDRYLRIVFKYVGKDWIFFDRAIFMGPSGDKIVFHIKTYDKTTDVDHGMVFETIDLPLTDEKAKEIFDILSEPGVKEVRLTGKYYKDYTLNSELVDAMKGVMQHYF